MILSTRQNPPRLLSLPRAPVSNNHSFASSRIYLLNSPLPSPSLPALLPRHGKKPPKLNSRKITRFISWLAILTFFIWAAAEILGRETAPSAINHVPIHLKSYEIIGEDSLPDFPLPVVVTDQKGSSKWTVSIPSHLDFPLTPSQYSDICAQVPSVSHHVANLKTQKANPLQSHAGHYDYYRKDPHFIDVADAQELNLLPTSSDVISFSSQKRICSKSLTYVLESTEAGLGSALLGLWQAYGFAKQEGRAFFIDDTHFPYGNYSSLFQPPPAPTCLPPPKTQRLPCPLEARHLVVSSASARYIFGQAFDRAIEDRRKTGIDRRENLFKMVRTGYEALFQLTNEDDLHYLDERAEELSKDVRAKQGLEIGIHIRHGDRHPFEFQYQGSYIPLSKYVEAAESSLRDLSVRNATASQIFVASDDPDVFGNTELEGTSKAQSRIALASRKAMGNRASGWEGGFFDDLFWGLGAPAEYEGRKKVGSPRPSWKADKPIEPLSASSAIALPGQQEGQKGKAEGEGDDDPFDPRRHPTAEALHLRHWLARAYLLDLSVLAQTDRVVCAVSSASCRLLAVMIGWERVATGAGQGASHWINVDGAYDWQGIGTDPI